MESKYEMLSEYLMDTVTNAVINGDMD